MATEQGPLNGLLPKIYPIIAAHLPLYATDNVCSREGSSCLQPSRDEGSHLQSRNRILKVDTNYPTDFSESLCECTHYVYDFVLKLLA